MTHAAKQATKISVADVTARANIVNEVMDEMVDIN